MYYIGIDLGTSAVKLLLMTGEGAVKKIVTEQYPLYFPYPGWSEQNPDDWWKAVYTGLKELTESLTREEKLQISGISFSGQMHGFVTLDDTDQVIRPAILWNDNRSEKETEYLNQVIGTENLSKYTGNIAFTGFTAPKILWMAKHEPEKFARIDKIMLPKDYLAYCLSGVHCSDYSDASGMLLLDVKHKCWSDEMIQICGISREMLPDLYESYEVVGTLKKKIAEDLGFSLSCKIIAGAGDNAAAAIGTGTVGNGSCNISLGTSGTIFISSDQFRVDEHNALHAFAHADGKYHLMGCMLSAASCYKWWTENILHTSALAEEQALVTPEKMGKNHVYFLPYLMGERSPHNDPNARGTFIGMTMDSTRADMTQAVLEGVAFAIRDSFEIAKSLGIQIERTRICGGGAKSPVWIQMIANILNIPVERISTEEGPGRGAAVLAAVGCGEYQNPGEAVKNIVKVIDVVKPDPEIAARYEEQYIKFAGLYPALKNVFSTL